ncbi:MAG: 2-oxoacid:acceptor oxidoreductase family protein [Deltaproteobacteria bacterium]|nr:2-oxoacid:acceptor oxidoreductase family protein [Deltaproteobacteria bacterium]
MEGYIEIRWHGRAQQGVVTAAKLLGETGLFEGKYVQAFPEFGPERMGAPVKAYNRLSDEQIKMHCQVTAPSVVLIVDPTLIGMDLAGGMETSGGVTEGALEDGIFIVNTPHAPSEMRKKLELLPTQKVFTVDAAHISIDTIGRLLPNTPMLGALTKVTGIIEFDSLISNFKDNYSKKFSEKILNGNVDAMKRGFEEVKGE